MGSPTVPITFSVFLLCLQRGGGWQRLSRLWSCEPAAQQSLQEPLGYPKLAFQVQFTTFSTLFHRGREESWVILSPPTQPCCAQPTSSRHWDWHLLFDRLLAVLHQQPDGRGCCVELGHLVLINDTPHSANIWVGRDTFKLSRRQSSDTAIPHCSPPAAPAQAAGAKQQLDLSMPLEGYHTVKPAQVKDPPHWADVTPLILADVP